MPELATLTLFLAAALALLIVPGPVVLYTVTRSVHQGWRAGVLSALAAGLGNFVHVLAATLGFSALLASSALAFSAVKYAGAAYLIYLGVRTLFAKDEPSANPALLPLSRSKIFLQGLLVSILNPKTALFFLAFLPQFVVPGADATGQLLLFGLIFVVLGVLTDSSYALLAGLARKALEQKTRLLGVQRYVTGSIYIALGLSAALTDTHRK